MKNIIKQILTIGSVAAIIGAGGVAFAGVGYDSHNGVGQERSRIFGAGHLTDQTLFGNGHGKDIVDQRMNTAEGYSDANDSSNTESIQKQLEIYNNMK